LSFIADGLIAFQKRTESSMRNRGTMRPYNFIHANYVYGA